MGLGAELAELIVREHLYRPLPDVVHTLGRLTTPFSYEQARKLIHRCGAAPIGVDREVDTSTLEARRSSEETITDTTFFRMLGAREVHAIDISDYEGAKIVWDLCRPVPENLECASDFIVGGSTLDNVFDPAQYLRNVARMLKPGGRFFDINHANNHRRPYVNAAGGLVFRLLRGEPIFRLPRVCAGEWR